MSLWRIELLHPLSVHFPITLLLFSTLCYLVAQFFSKKSWAPNFYFCFRLLLALGVLSAWVAFITGGKAEEVVNKVLCDPTRTHDHEEYAEMSAWIFSIVLMLEFAQLKWKTLAQKKFKGTLILVQLLGLIAGSGILGYTAHIGASLVYQQAAAVHVPSAECKEFE